MTDNERDFQDFIHDVKFDDSPDHAHRDRVEHELRSALGGHARLKDRSFGSRRVVIQGRIRKLAVAAVIIVAALVGTYKVGGFVRVTTIALADVEVAFLAETAVHLIYDNGAESWHNLRTGDHCLRDWDGRCVYIDYASNMRWHYHAPWGEHISQDQPRVYSDGVVPRWEPKTAWESILGHLDKAAEYGSKGHWEVEKVMDRVNGQELVRFDRYYNDAIDRRLLIKQIWADPRSRLPVRIWERLSLADRKEQNRESITGEFDFPQTTPSSIYDLGVSRDLPIGKDLSKIADPLIEDVLEAGEAASHRFPDKYRLIVWQNEGSHEVDVKYCNGEKVRQSRYFSLEREPYHLDVPCTASDVLQWTQTQVPVGVTLVDGEKRYRKSTPHSGFPDANSLPVVRVTREKSLMLTSWPHDKQWPYVNRSPSSFELIEDLPEELAGCIGLRINAGDIRRDFYVDPDHGYICVRWIWWKERSGNWEKEREYELSGFTRLPGGQWYVRSCILTTYADPTRGTSQGGANWSVDIELLDEEDFPPDIFNGAKLLEGTKIESY
ncbi:MAG: hypothetical protein ACYS8Z_26100 [Planctomycetota bacterium]|jgi:hypothetical protein